MERDPDLPRPDSVATCALLDRVAAGDAAAAGELMERGRPALAAFVELHLDRRVAARVDPSDVVQEAQADLARRLSEFLQRRPMPFHLWARKTAYERLLNLHRRHLRAGQRAVGRERPLPDRSSVMLAGPLLARGPSPSQEAAAREFAERVGRVVAGLPDEDREVLLLRRVDGLPCGEIASLLGITPAAARKRLGRAVNRLRQALADAGLLGDNP
jgi:RNA polymerase sigma-70 factor (ECF subfamily)